MEPPLTPDHQPGYNLCRPAPHLPPPSRMTRTATQFTGAARRGWTPFLHPTPPHLFRPVRHGAASPSSAQGPQLRSRIERLGLAAASIPYGVAVRLRNFSYDRGWLRTHRVRRRSSASATLPSAAPARRPSSNTSPAFTAPATCA